MNPGESLPTEFFGESVVALGLIAAQVHSAVSAERSVRI